jgi:hypothetical protein
MDAEERANELFTSCTCHEAYKGRDLVDPGCSRCQWHYDVVELLKAHAAEAVKESRKEVKDLTDEIDWVDKKRREEAKTLGDELAEQATRITELEGLLEASVEANGHFKDSRDILRVRLSKARAEAEKAVALADELGGVLTGISIRAYEEGEAEFHSEQALSKWRKARGGGVMTNEELIALATLVESSSRQMKYADEQRLLCGNSVAYGDVPAMGQDELEDELKKRGIINQERGE